MWIQGVDLMSIEASLLRHMPGDNAAGPIRAVAERMQDLVSVVVRVAEILTGGEPLGSSVESLLVRLELGLPASAVPLARRLHRRLDRADYLSLERAGLMTPEAIIAASEETLVGALHTKAKAEAVSGAARALIPPAETLAEETLVMPHVESD